MNECPNCGQYNQSDSTNCTNCGYTLKQVTYVNNIIQKQTNGLAIASLVLGILSLFCIGWVSGTLALIFGLISLSQINNSGGIQGGRGLAIAGVVLGPIGIITSIIYGIFSLGFGCLL